MTKLIGCSCPSFEECQRYSCPACRSYLKHGMDICDNCYHDHPITGPCRGQFAWPTKDYGQPCEENCQQFVTNPPCYSEGDFG